MQTRRVRADLCAVKCYMDQLMMCLVSSDVLYARGNCKKLAKPYSLSVRDGTMLSKPVFGLG